LDLKYPFYELPARKPKSKLPYGCREMYVFLARGRRQRMSNVGASAHVNF